MTRRKWWVLAAASVIAVLLLANRIPWSDAVAAAGAVRAPLLLAALGVNLISPLAKGWSWHLLLRPVAPHRWRVAQEANLVGTAVSSISVGVTGEAARVSLIARRARVPAATAALSVAWRAWWRASVWRC